MPDAPPARVPGAGAPHNLHASARCGLSTRVRTDGPAAVEQQRRRGRPLARREQRGRLRGRRARAQAAAAVPRQVRRVEVGEAAAAQDGGRASLRDCPHLRRGLRAGAQPPGTSTRKWSACRLWVACSAGPAAARRRRRRAPACFAAAKPKQAWSTQAGAAEFLMGSPLKPEPGKWRRGRRRACAAPFAGRLSARQKRTARRCASGSPGPLSSAARRTACSACSRRPRRVATCAPATPASSACSEF